MGHSEMCAEIAQPRHLPQRGPDSPQADAWGRAILAFGIVRREGRACRVCASQRLQDLLDIFRKTASFAPLREGRGRRQATERSTRDIGLFHKQRSYPSWGRFGLALSYPPVAYFRHAVRRNPLPSAGDHSGPVPFSSSIIPLSQAASSPNSLHSFDETTSHARDAPRRVLSHVLFRGVVTPGLGMNESRAFFVANISQPRSFPA